MYVSASVCMSVGGCAQSTCKHTHMRVDVRGDFLQHPPSDLFCFYSHVENACLCVYPWVCVCAGHRSMPGDFFHFIYLKQGHLLKLKFTSLATLCGQQAGILLSLPSLG